MKLSVKQVKGLLLNCAAVRWGNELIKPKVQNTPDFLILHTRCRDLAFFESENQQVEIRKNALILKNGDEVVPIYVLQELVLANECFYIFEGDE